MDLYRKISQYIENHLKRNNERILVVEGARQIGKSFIIRQVGRKLYENYIELNMEEDRLGNRIFSEARTVSDFYLALSVVAGSKMKEKGNTLVFIDEIQAYDHLLALLKFLQEDGRFTYIASGSLLGIALRQTSSLPMGSIEIKRMYPMDFEEFLIANGVGELALESMRKCFIARQSLSESLHGKMLDLFKKYLITGGLPAVVKVFVEEKNVAKMRKIQADTMALYGVDASKYEQEHTRLKIRRIYEMIPSNLENKKKRMVVKDIEGKKGKRMSDYEEEFDYLVSSGVSLEVKAISVPTYPLVENSGKNLLKLYLNDVGLLTALYYKNNIQAILQDLPSVNLGSVYETVVAQELAAHGCKLYYYDNKKNGEVDFLVDDADSLSVLPLEIKSGKDYIVHSALDKFLAVKDCNIKQAFVLSNESKVVQKGGITYMPVYYVMFIGGDA